MKWKARDSLPALVFDIENRPLSYWFDGASTAEVTVIAYKWLGSSRAKALVAGGSVALVDVLEAFRPVYERAGVVIGHHVRGHDLPILNGAYIELGYEALEPKLTIDTLKDLVRWKDIPRSLDYLGDWLGCPIAKPHMSQHAWREANRFTAAGLKAAEKRCRNDVLVTEWCYHELLRRGLLTKPPRTWAP